MAKREPGNTGPLRIVRPHHPQRYYLTSWLGKEVVKAWPRERPNWNNPTNLEQREEMKYLAASLKQVAPEEQAAARVIARGSAYIWRDVLSRAMIGRLIDITEQEVMTPQEYLDLLSSVPGTVLVRTADEWVGLAPGAAGQVLTVLAGQIPGWAAVEGGGGLYGPALHTPTLAGSGLATWANQQTATAIDSDAGIYISGPSTGGSGSLNFRYKTAPTPPYAIRGLIAMAPQANNSPSGGLLWYNGSNKCLVAGLVYVGAWSPRVQEWASPTAFNSQPSNAGNTGPMIWIELKDTGTNAVISMSNDGANYTPIYSTGKAGSYLGSTGYANIGFFNNSQGSPQGTTLMSLQQL